MMPAPMASSVPRCISTAPAATATRSDSGFWPTSTMCAWPAFIEVRELGHGRKLSRTIMRMRRLALIGALAAGCAGSVAHVRVAVEMTGAGAGPAEQQRCLETVRAAGAVVDGQAAMHALITVEPNGNRVQVMSNRRGLVHDAFEPQAPVEQLCKEAVAEAKRATAREPLPAPTEEPRAHIADVPRPTATSTSGGASNGPISDQ